MQTILIVDDEPNIVEGLASQLQQNYGDRAIVLRAYSGTHALSILRENQVDVILSDICMPDLDGLSLMEETESSYGEFHGDSAIIEMAAASGLPMVPVEKRNPLNTTTFGTGELIRDALDSGYRKISIAIGGSATNDGGMGAMAAL